MLGANLDSSDSRIEANETLCPQKEFILIGKHIQYTDDVIALLVVFHFLCELWKESPKSQ